MVFEMLLRQLSEVFGWVRFKFFHARFAAELDLLPIVRFQNRSAHAVEIIIGHNACGERIRFRVFVIDGAM